MNDVSHDFDFFISNTSVKSDDHKYLNSYSKIICENGTSRSKRKIDSSHWG